MCIKALRRKLFKIKMSLYPFYEGGLKSPDLAPSDYFLFLQLMKHLKGNHYDSDEEVVAAIRQWCREQSPEFFADGIRQLVRRYQLCVDRDGDYVEKINMRCVAEVSSFNLMYNLSMYYEKQKSYDKTELTFQPTLVLIKKSSLLHKVHDYFVNEHTLNRHIFSAPSSQS